jgi:hypothetical protein
VVTRVLVGVHWGRAGDDRPTAARDAVNSAVAQGLDKAIDMPESVVIRGAAGQVFCAGADLNEFSAGRTRELNTERGGFALACFMAVASQGSVYAHQCITQTIDYKEGAFLENRLPQWSGR